MRTVANIIAQALRIAKVPNYTADALDTFNTILSDLCQSNDFALARGLFQFNFDPTLSTNFGSGPYALPLDYLRASGSSGEAQKTFFWTLNGVPYPMVPCDLSEFDMQVQQVQQASYPWLWATDMGGPLTDRIVLVTTASLTAGNTSGTVISNTGLATGQAMAGEGVAPGTTITLSGLNITLSRPATATNVSASVFFGIAPTAYAYPPPSGSFPVTIRYQRMMPPIQNTAKIPWFPDEGYLVEELAGRMMQESDDTRVTEFIGNDRHSGRAGRRLARYISQMDDKRNRPSTVELDRRRFGPTWTNLKNTKTIGW